MNRSTVVALCLAAGAVACSSIGLGVGIGVPIGRGGIRDSLKKVHVNQA